MARLIGRSIRNGPPAPAPQIEDMRYNAGDPVAVRPDEVEWGTGENAANGFYRIEVPGASVDSLIALLEPGMAPVKLPGAVAKLPNAAAAAAASPSRAQWWKRAYNIDLTKFNFDADGLTVVANPSDILAHATRRA